jgi:hypothetical protein
VHRLLLQVLQVPQPLLLLVLHALPTPLFNSGACAAAFVM